MTFTVNNGANFSIKRLISEYLKDGDLSAVNVMRVYSSLIPARSGSKGLPDKNIASNRRSSAFGVLDRFRKKLPIDRVIVSLNSNIYQRIATRYGAECPYLRGPKASSDIAMEEDILADLNEIFLVADRHS